jgi:hypothetical protein
MESASIIDNISQSNNTIPNDDQADKITKHFVDMFDYIAKQIVMWTKKIAAIEQRIKNHNIFKEAARCQSDINSRVYHEVVHTGLAQSDLPISYFTDKSDLITDRIIAFDTKLLDHHSRQLTHYTQCKNDLDSIVSEIMSKVMSKDIASDGCIQICIK